MDWVRYDRQFRIGINRNDMLRALARADFINANRAEGELSVRWQDCDPYTDEFEEELTAEQLVARMGLGRRSGQAASH